MKFKSVIFGTLVSAIIIIAVVAITAFLSYFTGISDSAANVIVYAGAAAGVFAGAFFSARSSGGKILWNALAVSAVCIVILIGVSLVVGGGINFNMHFIAMLLGSLAAGFLGAVIAK